VFSSNTNRDGCTGVDEDLNLFCFPVFAPIECRPRDEAIDWGVVGVFDDTTMLGLRMIDRSAELSEARRVVGALLGENSVAEVFGTVAREIAVLVGAVWTIVAVKIS
jgi:hypothetical protein